MAAGRDVEMPDTSPLKNTKLPVIWILGGPGSGKGTLCEKIKKVYCFTHISSGDLLRNEVQTGSLRGKALQQTMEKGELAPTEIVLALIAEKMLAELCKTKGFLIDGYPRETKQGIEFESNIRCCDLIIYLEAPDDVMLNRLLNRGKNSRRIDDNEDVIKKRLVTFHAHNDSIVQYYNHKLFKIDGTNTPEACFQAASKKIQELCLIR